MGGGRGKVGGARSWPLTLGAHGTCMQTKAFVGLRVEVVIIIEADGASEERIIHELMRSSQSGCTSTVTDDSDEG